MLAWCALVGLLWLLAVTVADDPTRPGDLAKGKWEPMAKPASADSLAGVIARLFGVDSSDVSKVRWYQLNNDHTSTADPAQYAYRGPVDPRANRGIAQTNWEDDTPVVTFARKVNPVGAVFGAPAPLGKSWATDPETVKHELGHAMVPDMKGGHPAELFRLLETYRGR